MCQGANYRQHMIESGVDPDQKRINMFFEKSDASITSATGDVRRPAHVTLLDYEVELGLVFGQSISAPISVTAANYHQHVFGLVIANDVSARDGQIPETQFFKGKSYRSFCPMGPSLTALEGDDHRYIDDLTLRLWVNDELRQQDSSANMVNKPAETLTEMSTFTDMDPGDVLLTGTPSGCALRPPKPAVQRIARALRGAVSQRTRFPGWGRRSCDAAFGRSGAQQRPARRGQSRLEAGGRDLRPMRPRPTGEL